MTASISTLFVSVTHVTPMSNSEAWKNGVIDGFQSVKPGLIPTIPSYPASVPAGERNQASYYYELGYKKGREMAQR